MYTMIRPKSGHYYSDTGNHTGTWDALLVLTTATFTTLTIGNVTGSPTATSLPAGTWIYGNITSVTASSGTYLLYKY